MVSFDANFAKGSHALGLDMIEYAKFTKFSGLLLLNMIQFDTLMICDKDSTRKKIEVQKSLSVIRENVPQERDMADFLSQLQSRSLNSNPTLYVVGLEG